MDKHLNNRADYAKSEGLCAIGYPHCLAKAFTACTHVVKHYTSIFRPKSQTYVCTNPFEECLYGEEQVPLSRVTAQIIKKKKTKKKNKKKKHATTILVMYKWFILLNNWILRLQNLQTKIFVLVQK